MEMDPTELGGFPSQTRDPALSERVALRPPEPECPSLSKSSQLRDLSLPGTGGTSSALLHVSASWHFVCQLFLPQTD